MFSDREREFLRTVRDAPAGAATDRLARAFPNPAYRRKLLWAIRRKAGRSVADWELYAAASDRDGRLLPSSPRPGGDRTVPRYVDPRVAVFGRLRRRLAPRRLPAAPPRPRRE